MTAPGYTVISDFASLNHPRWLTIGAMVPVVRKYYLQADGMAYTQNPKNSPYNRRWVAASELVLSVAEGRSLGMAQP